MRQRLGINIDHVATIRNARGGSHPEILRAAQIVKNVGADSITIHLREDRRHIRDEDLENLVNWNGLPLNLEMAATDEMVDIALMAKTHAVCIVPEKREERTTEGGLDAKNNIAYLKNITQKLQENGSRVSLFIEPDLEQIEAVIEIGAKAFEIHTGTYCEQFLANDKAGQFQSLENFKRAAKFGAKNNLEVHAGHGLTYESVVPIAKISEIIELNIGHFLIGEAIYIGLENSIIKMRNIMDAARA